MIDAKLKKGDRVRVRGFAGKEYEGKLLETPKKEWRTVKLQKSDGRHFSAEINDILEVLPPTVR